MSAATKIAFFTRPTENIFIWDRMARYALWCRDAFRAGAGFLRADFDDPYIVRGGRQDYAAFTTSSRLALNEELASADFIEALTDFRGFLRATDGPMADPAYLGGSFVERRLLDKVLWVEGSLLADRRADICAPAV